MTWLIVFSILCLGAFFFAREMRRSQVETDTVKHMEDLGYDVEFEYGNVESKGGGGFGQVKLEYPGPEWLKAIFGEKVFSRIVSIDLSGHVQVDTSGHGQVDTSGHVETLENLSLDNFSRLRTLTINSDRLKSLAGISNLRSLNTLVIASDNLENLDGIEHLRTLEHVRLSCCDEGRDDGIKLTNIAGLSSLNLSSFSLEYFSGDISLAPLATHQALKNLFIEGCNGIKEINFENWQAANLEHLQIKSCSQLALIEGVPKNTDSLEVSRCSALKKINIRNQTNLQSIYIEECPQFASVDGLPETLEILDLEYCLTNRSRLIPIGSTIRISTHQDLPNLKTAKISCDNSSDCVIDGTFKNVEYLELESCDLKNFDVFQNFPNLTRLNLSACDELASIDGLPENLEALDLTWCDKLEHINVNQRSPNLTRLRINGCAELGSIDGLPENLKELDLLNCQKLERLNANQNLPNVRKVSIRDCKRLVDVPKAIKEPNK